MKEVTVWFPGNWGEFCDGPSNISTSRNLPGGIDLRGQFYFVTPVRRPHRPTLSPALSKFRGCTRFSELGGPGQVVVDLPLLSRTFPLFIYPDISDLLDTRGVRTPGSSARRRPCLKLSFLVFVDSKGLLISSGQW